MNPDHDDSSEILREIWRQDARALQELDAECSPTKVCRNMKDVTFDGFAEDGVDLSTSWRNKLAREGKLTGAPVSELVFGPSD